MCKFLYVINLSYFTKVNWKVVVICKKLASGIYVKGNFFNTVPPNLGNNEVILKSFSYSFLFIPVLCIHYVLYINRECIIIFKKCTIDFEILFLLIVNLLVPSTIHFLFFHFSLSSNPKISNRWWDYGTNELDSEDDSFLSEPKWNPGIPSDHCKQHLITDTEQAQVRGGDPEEQVADIGERSALEEAEELEEGVGPYSKHGLALPLHRTIHWPLASHRHSFM